MITIIEMPATIEARQNIQSLLDVTKLNIPRFTNVRFNLVLEARQIICEKLLDDGQCDPEAVAEEMLKRHGEKFCKEVMSHAIQHVKDTLKRISV